MRRWWWVSVVAGGLLVFALHFRPWEGGLLEDWETGNQWAQHGWGALPDSMRIYHTGRPLHFLLYYFGLWLANGSFVGGYLMLGLVAAGQFAAVLWALRPVSGSRWLSLGIALLIGLNPLWGVGYVLRFFPSQVMTLALFVSAGLLIRYARSGRWPFLLGSALVQLYGLLTYQAAAVVWIVAAVALALAVGAGWRRTVLAGAVSLACSAAVAAYSFAIAPLINPSSYETVSRELGGGSIVGPVTAVRQLLGTIIGQLPYVLLAIVLLVVLAAVLHLTGSIRTRQAWLIVGLALGSPLAGLAYINTMFWLSDAERVANTTSLTIAIALLVWAIGSTGRHPRLELIAAGAGVAGSIALVGVAIANWAGYAAVQQRVLAIVEPAVREATGDETVVVVDHSGVLGDTYTLLSAFHLTQATQLTFGDPTEDVLCTSDEVPVRHFLPACGDLEIDGEPADFAAMTPAGGGDIPGGRIDVYIAR